MANHASHAALPYPVKGARYTVQVPYLDADGDPTDPATPDTEISKDGGAFADCAEEVATITGGNGVGFLTLSGAETDCSMAALAAKVGSGPKATLLTLYPRVLAVLFSGTAQAGAASSLTLATDVPAVASLLVGCILKTTGGTGGGGTGGANNQARVITAFTTGRVATVTPNWETTPDATTTYEVLLTEAALLRYADLQLWRGSQPNALTSSRVDASVGAMASGVLTATAIAGDAITAAKVAPDVTTELQAGLATATALANVQADTDDIQSRLPAALVGGRIAANAEVVGDKTGYALAAGEYTALVNAIWDELTSEARTAGSYGQKLKDLVLTAAGRVDVGLWLGSAPNALVSGDVPANVRAFLAGALTSAAFAVDAIDAVALKADAAQEIADALLDRASAIEGFTPRQLARLMASVLLGKVSGLPTAPAYRDLADTKDRVTASTDADGNRTSLTRDAS